VEVKAPPVEVENSNFQETASTYDFDTYSQGDPSHEIKYPPGMLPPTLEQNDQKCMFPARNKSEIDWLFLVDTHNMSRNLKEDVRKFIRKANKYHIPSHYRERQLRSYLPVLPLKIKNVSSSKKYLKNLAKRAMRRKKRDQKRAALASQSDSDDSSSGSEVERSRAGTMHQVPFVDLVDGIRRLIQWPGNFEAYEFLPKIAPGGRAAQLVNGSIFSSQIQFTAESLYVPKLSARVGHGAMVYYRRESDDLAVLGEVTGMCRLGDKQSWEDVIGNEKAIHGGLPAALDRMRDAGGGVSGNPKESVPMVFRVRPYTTLRAMQKVGVVDFQDEPEEEDQSELFVMFDVEHVVLPVDVLSLVKVWGSTEEAKAHAVFGSESFHSARSVMHTFDSVGGRHFTVFPSVDLPKPLYRLFDSEKLKSNLRSKPAHIPVIRVFLVYFTDSYAVFSKVWHSTLGCYLTIGNLPAHLQDLLRNLIPMQCVPPNADLYEAFEPFFSRVRQLEEGLYVDLGCKLGQAFLVGGIGLIRLDMPEGSDYCSCLRQGGILGCRRCHTTKDNFEKVLSPLEVAKVIRTFHGAQEMRVAAETDYSSAQQKKVLAKVGLQDVEGSFLAAKLRTDPFRQAPHDPLHLEKLGFGKKLLNALFESLTPAAAATLAERIQLFPTFATWSQRLPKVKLTTSKKTSKQTVNIKATSIGRVIAVLVLIVRKWLTEDHFTDKFRTSALASAGVEWLTYVRGAIALVARSLFVTLSTHRQYKEGDTSASDVFEAVRNARHVCFDLWPLNFNNPTQHAGSHHAEATVEQGLVRMSRTSKGEVKHHQMRGGVVGLNGGYSPEVLMMRAENLRQAGLFWAHGGHEHLRGAALGKGFIRALRGDFIQDMLSRSINTTTYADESKGYDDVSAMYGGIDSDPDDSDLEESELDLVEMRTPVEVAIPVVGTKKGPVVKRQVTLELKCLEQLLLCAKVDATTMLSFMRLMTSHDVNVSLFLKYLNAKVLTWIEPAYRPPYCRRIASGLYYTFAVEAPVATARVGYLTDVVELCGHFCVRVDWMSQCDSVDDETGLDIVRRSGISEMLSASAVLEPRHVVHCCEKDQGCTTSGAGFEDGFHGVENKYLDNAYFTF
jgi:hypothetical protein